MLLGHRTARLQPPDFQRLTVRHGTVYSARFAPDGHNVIYSASWDGAPVEIFSTDLKSTGRAKNGVAGNALACGFFRRTKWRCCRRSIQCFMLTSRGTLGQVPLTGGSPRQIAENIEWADWSPDGKTLAVVRDTGGSRRLEFPLGHVLYETPGWIGHPVFRPKETKLLFWITRPVDDDQGVVSLVDLQGARRFSPRVGKARKGWHGLLTEARFGSRPPKPDWNAASYAVELTGRQTSGLPRTGRGHAARHRSRRQGAADPR